jgi:sigma-B regulation protein RsbU (phosphoserine phosphatase)
LRANGELIKLEPTATMLGAFEEWNCGEEEVSLDVGDTLLLYSDGVTEAADFAGDDFSEDRLANILRDNRTATAHDLVSEVVKTVSTFSDTSRTDDITVVAIRSV